MWGCPLLSFTAASLTRFFTYFKRLFTMLDYLAEHHNIMKVETIGDCYIVAAGVAEADSQGFYQVDRGSTSQPGVALIGCGNFPIMGPKHGWGPGRGNTCFTSGPLCLKIQVRNLQTASRPLPNQIQDGSDAVGGARRVMAFAKDMLRCSREVGICVAFSSFLRLFSERLQNFAWLLLSCSQCECHWEF